MLNQNMMYSVTGRYMEGQKIVGYHLVGEDGSQAKESKEHIIRMINMGRITNMRVQTGSDGEEIIRGKGINLNKLPVYDLAKQQFRDNEASQSAASSKVSVSRSSLENINSMGQYHITKRIMFKNKCMGYELQDYSGRVTRMQRDKVLKLAVERLIANAVANKVIDKNTGLPILILRGVGVELRNIPSLIMTENGNIIDPVRDANKVIRCTFLKYNGILRDEKTGKSSTFKKGDYMVCNCTGDIDIEDKNNLEGNYTRDMSLESAVGDDYFMDNRYSVEIFGAQKKFVNTDMIKKWYILKMKGC